MGYPSRAFVGPYQSTTCVSTCGSPTELGILWFAFRTVQKRKQDLCDGCLQHARSRVNELSALGGSNMLKLTWSNHGSDLDSESSVWQQYSLFEKVKRCSMVPTRYYQ